MAGATNRDTADGVDAGVAAAFERAVAVDMLESQALRTLALGVLFGAATVFLGVLWLTLAAQYGWREAVAPLTVFTVVGCVAAYEFAMRGMIRRTIRRGGFVPRAWWYANACVEITAMSALILLIQGTLSNPVYALAMPPLLAYCVFTLLSTLYLDMRLSLFTGGLAAAEYLGIVVATFARFGTDAAHDAIFLTPGIYLGKTCILLLAAAGAGFVARELTRRQRLSLRAAAERDREQRANAMKSQFLADMSHEIRTPLNAVIGYAQLLETDAAITPDQRRAVEAIRVGSRHLLAVVNDVLDLSKIEAGGERSTPVRFDLAALLGELTLIFAARCAEKRLAWIYDAPAAASGPVAGDAAKLRQVLTNLLGNAVKFTEAGHVALRAAVAADGRWRFEVEDTGPGIAAERHAEIFDPFAQDAEGRAKGGTGLGLAIAQRHVALMGGALTVDSAPGAGARFRFTVPLLAVVELDAPEEAAPSGPRLAPGRPVRALVVDDVAANREVLVRLLARMGVRAEAADCAAAALEAGERARFDIAFLDIRMPDMAGTELARRLRTAGAGAPRLVAVSASALAHQRAEYLAAGFDDFVDKPVRIDRLRDCLARLPGVAFEAASPANGAASGAPAVLPAALHRSLTEAARGHNITALKRHIAETEALGGAGREVAFRLRELGSRYDMAGVQAALAEIAHD